MTQPSEFEQAVESLRKYSQSIAFEQELAKLLILHYASTRTVLERLKRAKIWGQVPEQWRSGNVKGGIYRQGFNAADIAWAENVDRELAALSGQEPAKPCKTCRGRRKYCGIKYEHDPAQPCLPHCPDCGGTGVAK